MERLKADYLAAHKDTWLAEEEQQDLELELEDLESYDDEDLPIDVVGDQAGEDVTGDSQDHSFCSSRTYPKSSGSEADLEPHDLGVPIKLEPQVSQSKALYNSPFSIESLLGS